MGKAPEAGGARYHLTWCEMQSHLARKQRGLERWVGTRLSLQLGIFIFIQKQLKQLKELKTRKKVVKIHI